MEEQNSDRIGLIARTETFPFPALISDGRGNLLHRNRMAKGLLPSPWRLRRFLLQKREEKEIFSAQMDGRYYFVGKIQREDCFLFIFLESFLPFYPAVSHALLKEAVEHMELLCKEEQTQTLPKEGKHLQEGLIARTVKIRRESDAYFRLLNAKSYATGRQAVLDLPSYLEAVKRELAGKRVVLEVEKSEPLGACFSPSSLAFILLSVLQFVFLFQGEERIRAKAKKRGNRVALSLIFPDEEGLFAAFFALTEEEKTQKRPFPAGVGLSPLFSALAVCREERLNVRILFENGQGTMEILLPGAGVLPEAFLGTEKSSLFLAIRQVVRELFPEEMKETNKKQ